MNITIAWLVLKVTKTKNGRVHILNTPNEFCVISQN